MPNSNICTAYSVKKCEKIDLSGQRLPWKALSDMREARHCFNPCQFKKYVYLCGNYSKLVEIFSPRTDTFLHFQLQLPEFAPCCVYVHNNSLVVHSWNYITQFSTEHAKHSKVRCLTPLDYKKSNSHPVLDPTRNIFFLFQENRCVSFNMKTGNPLQGFY